MRKKLLDLLRSLDNSQDWVKNSVSFIESSETKLVSEKGGSLTASAMLSEMKIHSWSVNRSGVKATGITELMSTLEMMSSDDVVRTYIFTRDEQTCIIYVDEAETRIIGSILIPVD